MATISMFRLISLFSIEFLNDNILSFFFCPSSKNYLCLRADNVYDNKYITGYVCPFQIVLLIAATFAQQHCFAVPVEDVNADPITTMAPARMDGEISASTQSENNESVMTTTPASGPSASAYMIAAPSDTVTVLADPSTPADVPVAAAAEFAAVQSDGPAAAAAEFAAVQADGPAAAAAAAEVADVPADGPVAAASEVAAVSAEVPVAAAEVAADSADVTASPAPAVTNATAEAAPAKPRADLICHPSGQFEYAFNNHMHYLVHMINTTEVDLKHPSNQVPRDRDNNIYCKYANNAELDEAHYHVYQIYVAKNLTNVHYGSAYNRTALEELTLL